MRAVEVENDEEEQEILHSTDTDNTGAVAVAEMLQDTSPDINIEGRTSMDLSHKKIGPEGAKVLSEALITNTTLTYLDLDNNQVGDQGAQALAQALQLNVGLACLSLRHNGLTSACAGAFAAALRRNFTLLELNLADNLLQDPGAIALAEALAENASLTDLNLENNKIQLGGQFTLAEVFERNTTLLRLSYFHENWATHMKSLGQLMRGTERNLAATCKTVVLTLALEGNCAVCCNMAGERVAVLDELSGAGVTIKKWCIDIATSRAASTSERLPKESLVFVTTAGAALDVQSMSGVFEALRTVPSDPGDSLAAMNSNRCSCIDLWRPWQPYGCLWKTPWGRPSSATGP